MLIIRLPPGNHHEILRTSGFHRTIPLRGFNAILFQIPEPFLLLGDFNAHNCLWGSDHVDARGRMIESILMSHSLCLFNTREPIYFSPSSLSSSRIEPSMVALPFLLLLYGSQILTPMEAITSLFSWKTTSPLSACRYGLPVGSSRKQIGLFLPRQLSLHVYHLIKYWWTKLQNC